MNFRCTSKTGNHRYGGSTTCQDCGRPFMEIQAQKQRANRIANLSPDEWKELAETGGCEREAESDSENSEQWRIARREWICATCESAIKVGHPLWVLRICDGAIFTTHHCAPCAIDHLHALD